ncbi:MAG: hypothetical protein R2706_10080 [Acidimicrobiales bacterium]
MADAASLEILCVALPHHREWLVQNSIAQFIWPHQRVSAFSVARRIEAAANLAGWMRDFEVLLVGVARTDECRHEICTETEVGGIKQSDAAGLLEEVDRLRADHPESNVLRTDPLG